MLHLEAIQKVFHFVLIGIVGLSFSFFSQLPEIHIFGLYTQVNENKVQELC